MTNIDETLEKMWKCEQIKPEEFKPIYLKGKEVLSKEENIVKVSLPVTVCGDIHGQFPDLMELFKVGGRVPETNYVFMGDFVDRGVNGIEVMMLLIGLKVKYPKRIVLLRGNHETRQISQNYGFYDECMKKYGSAEIWRECCELFDMISLSAIIDNSIFCVHGGLSKDAETINDISNIQRKMEAPREGIMCDLLWSDPDSDITRYQNSTRGAGYLFGEEIVKEFLHTNNLKFIARAHQVVMEGYEWKFKKQLVTIWSAPNYCYRMGNKASIMELDDRNNINFLTYDAAPANERTDQSLIDAYKEHYMTMDLFKEC